MLRPYVVRFVHAKAVKFAHVNLCKVNLNWKNVIITFFNNFIYKYNVYCHKIHTSFLASHLWHVYIVHIISKGGGLLG